MRLLIRASDAEAAIALLDAQASPSEMDQIEIEAVASALPETIPLKRLAWGQILFGIVIGALLCFLYQRPNKLGTKTHYRYTKDGKADAAWVYRDGHLVEFSQDRNLDGAWDHWVYYDERGEASKSEYDNNFDGKPDETWTYSNGSLATMEKDTDFNGTPDLFCTYKNDIIQQADFRPNGFKFTTTREVFQNGVLTEIWRGGDRNGNFNEVVRYDPFFNPMGTNVPNVFKLSTPSSN